MTDAYDPQNIFGKILRGEMPGEKVYEDDAVLAVMDIFPHARGHILVIPKTAARNLLDVDPAALSRAAATLPKLARAVKTAMKADGIRLAQFNEAPAGQTVFHLHFHIIPYYEAAPPKPAQAPADPAELKRLAPLITAAIE